MRWSVFGDESKVWWSEAADGYSFCLLVAHCSMLVHFADYFAWFHSHFAKKLISVFVPGHSTLLLV